MKKTYTGSCHCGKIQIEIKTDLSERTTRCNCSICSKKRYWGAIVKPEDFRLISGTMEDMGDYQFATKTGHHRFCKVCGIGVFSDGHLEELGGDYYSINIACLDNISPKELADLPVTYCDGLNNNWWNPPQETGYL